MSKDKPTAAERIARAKYVEENYERIVRPAMRALAEQRLRLATFLEDFGVRGVYRVSSRIKSRISLAKHIQSGRYTRLADVPDLAGMRIVVHTQADADLVEECFMRQVRRNALKLEKRKVVEHKGYRARHLILEVPASYLRSRYACLLEVQIRTLADEVFNVIARDYWYKSEGATPPNEVQKQILEHLREADELASKIRDHGVSALALDRKDALTPFSFRSIVQQFTGETVSLEDAVDQILTMRDLGQKTNGDLYAVFEDEKHKTTVNELVAHEDEIADPDKTYKGSGHLFDLFLLVDRNKDVTGIKRHMAYVHLK